LEALSQRSSPRFNVGDGRYAAQGSPSTATNDPHGFLPGESDLVRMALTYDILTLPGADGETVPPRGRSPTWSPKGRR
jgi:hypothetical protein